MEQAPPGKRARSQTNSAEEADAASAADAAGNVEVSKADVSNLMGRLKNSSDNSSQKVLLEYQMLPRYDKSKADLVRKWKMDRSCTWAREIKEEENQKTELASNSLVGWLTR